MRGQPRAAMGAQAGSHPPIRPCIYARLVLSMRQRMHVCCGTTSRACTPHPHHPCLGLDCTASGAWHHATTHACCAVLCCAQIVATKNQVVTLDHVAGTRHVAHEADPMTVPEALSRAWRPAPLNIAGLSQGVFTGGFVGYAGYDTVRYVYAGEQPHAQRTCACMDGLTSMNLGTVQRSAMPCHATPPPA